MKIGREHIILAVIVILALALRIYLSSFNSGFDYDSYFALRQAENIKETGLPLYDDPLSYSGRSLIFPPLFYYLLAGFSLIMPLEWAAKLLPNLLFSGLAIIVFMISKHLTKNRTAALLAAFFAAFVPIAYSTINTVPVTSLSLILAFFLCYSFLRIDEKGWPTITLIAAILLLLTESSIFMLLLCFLLFFLILILQQEKPSLREREMTVFLFFLGLWYHIIIYKKAFFINGLNVILKNLPAPLLSSYFQDIDFFGLFYAVGVIPLLLGVYAIYHVFFKTKSRAANLFISFAIISFLLLWFKLIPISTGLLFLSTSIIILSSHSIKNLLVSFSKTKIASRESMITIVLLVLFIITTLPPLLASAHRITPPSEDMHALRWIRENTPQDSVVFGSVKEGFLINYASDRRNVIDSNFLFIHNINQKYADAKALFNLRLKSEAVRLINQYKIDYIFLSRQSMDDYNITALFYADPDCFEKAYDTTHFGGGIIYKFLGCKI